MLGTAISSDLSHFKFINIFIFKKTLYFLFNFDFKRKDQ